VSVVGNPATVNAMIQRASVALASDPVAAGREAEAVLKLAPNDPRAQLILASSRRRGGDIEAAYAILAPLAKAYPRAAHTQYELGATLAARGDRAAAIVALRAAVAINPSIAEAWRALGDQLFLEGDAAGADAAFAEHGRALVTDPALRPAADAMVEGRLADAETFLRRHLSGRPRDGVALRLLGETLVGMARYAEAETVLAGRLSLDDQDHGARFTYAKALFRQQKAAETIVEVERLLAEDGDVPAYRNLLAGSLALVADYDRVIEIYNDLLAQFERQPRVWLNLGHALRTVGRREDAINAYRRAIDLAPDLGEAYWSLANLKVATFGGADEEAMATQLARADLADDNRQHLYFALGKALEDRRDYEGSFRNYAAGAVIRRAEVHYVAGAETRFVSDARALFTDQFFSDRRGWGAPTPDPIFIVGLPRSGSTLIEQILASHSQVEGTMELPDMNLIASRLDIASLSGKGPGYPACLADLTAREVHALGESYLETTRVQRKLGRPFFIDKMPNNLWHAGLIQLILPNARIIDARRHPMGACFSCFKQHFAQGQGFTYDLTDLGRYYRRYVELMDHMDVVTPGRVHRVIYEDVVADTEAEVRRLLDYCGLLFEEGCLRFHENERAVRTVSSEQVRRPIFREGLDQWRHYEPWLQPLKIALGPCLEHWRGTNAAPYT